MVQPAAEPPARFAVGFTSAMAGVVLAAEMGKMLLSQGDDPRPVGADNATFRFWAIPSGLLWRPSTIRAHTVHSGHETGSDPDHSPGSEP